MSAIQMFLSRRNLAHWVIVCVVLASLAAPAQDQRVEPDHARVPYGRQGEHNWMHIYLAEGTAGGPPTPVYLWAHGNDGSADGFPAALWKQLSPSGISAVSWESIPHIVTEAELREALRDVEDVVDFVIANAATYNWDPTRIFIGGSSRGSILSWKIAHERHEHIRGTYSTGLPEPLIDPKFQAGMWNYLDLINKDSPPLFVAYPATPGDGNVHNPEVGLRAKARYEELGIGDRATIEHSLDARGKARWDFIVAFIRGVTAAQATANAE